MKLTTRESTVPSRGASARTSRGFTLVELITVMGIIGVLATIGIPAYQHTIAKARVSRCASDIKTLQTEIFAYYMENDALPDSLADIGRDQQLDAYGRPYQYLNIPNNLGSERQDSAILPLNVDFDLYSFGQDGLTTQQINTLTGSDDVVRGGDGGFIGLASNY